RFSIVRPTPLRGIRRRPVSDRSRVMLRLGFCACACALALAAGCAKPAPALAPPAPPVVTVEYPVERTLDSFTEFTGYLRAVEVQDIRAQVTGYLKKIDFV